MANYSDIRYVATGVTEYATADNLPTSGNTTGDQALVTGTNRLYIWNGSGWYNIALINTTPSISGVSSSYDLATDGTATTVTITATDAEGLPITYSIASDTSGNVATVTQGTGANTNVFTITPSTSAANSGTFSLTFRASDGVNIATAVSSFTLEFIVQNSKYTSALITSVGADSAVNNSFDDASTNNHTITANGNVTQSTFSPYRSGGYSTYFDGTGDYIRYTDASLAIGTDDFTIEFWIRREGTQSQNDSPIAQGTTPGWQICFNTANNLVFMKDGSARDLSTGTLTEKQWYHVVYQRDSGTLQGFLDGVSLGTVSGVTTNFTNTTIEVGVNRGGTAYYSGNLRDVRVISGTALYSSSGFTPPTEPLTAVSGTGYSTILLTCHLPYIADGGANSLTSTINGNTKVDALTSYDSSKYNANLHGGSMYFDGSGDYLTIAHDTTLKPGTSGAFSVEFWYYPTATPSGNPAQIAGDLVVTSYPSNCSGFDLTHDTSGNFNVRWGSPAYQDGSSGDGGAITNNALALNQWHHIVLCRDAESTPTMALFRNGKRCWYEAGSQVAITDATASNFYVGYAGNASGATLTPITGIISDFKFRKGATSFDPTSSTLTVSTTPSSSDTETSLLISGTNAGIIDKSQSVQTLTLNGDVKSSTTQTKYLSSSIYFDGSGDYVQTPTSNLLTFGSEDFTVEGWFYTTSSGAYQYIFDGRNGGTDVTYLYLNNGTGLYAGYGNVNDSSVATLSLNQWYHFAYVRNGSGTNNITVYIDGTAEWQITNTTDLSSTTRITLGSRYTGADYFGGYISDFRITKGLARYTANFTPPTAALGG